MCKHTNLIKSPDDYASISDYIASIRAVRGYTLQEVADQVVNAVAHKVLPAQCSLTRAYLSRLEAGTFHTPSPFKLQALAHVYHIPYESLLQKVGYLQPADDKKQQDLTFTLMLQGIQEMTLEEVHAVLEYIEYVKSKRTRRCPHCQ